MEWYYILGIISYGIFIIQFLLSSFFGGDTEIDVDFDGEGDFDTSSLLSFKGLVHFAMGFSGWLMLTGKVTVLTVCTGVLIGVIFMMLLYYLYKLCMHFHSEPTEKDGMELIGHPVTVIFVWPERNYCVGVPVGLPYREIQCFSSTPLNIGDRKTITSYTNSIYQID